MACLRLWVWVVILGLLGSLSRPAGALDDSPEATETEQAALLEFVQAGLRHRQQAVTTLAAQLALEQYRRLPGETAISGHAWNYALWLEGPWWREDWAEIHPDARRTTWSGDGTTIWFCDGNSAGGPWQRGDAMVNANWWLDLMKGRPENCPSALLLAARDATVTEATVGGTTWLRAERVDRVRGRDVWWIDPRHGYAVARLDSSWEQTPKALAGGSSYLVDTWQEMNGYWLPRHVRSVRWSLEADGSRRWVTIVRVRVVVDDRPASAPRFFTEIYPLGAWVKRSEQVVERFGGDLNGAIARLQSHVGPPDWMQRTEPVDQATTEQP